jgi:hypothetical protein
MDLTKVIAIAGKPGLFNVIGQTGKGLVVESLLDGKRLPTYPTQQVSALSEISIYGNENDKPLKEIFESIFKLENGGKPSIDAQGDKDAIRTYFSDIYPDYAADRVYDSDIRKVLRWYAMLHDKGLMTMEAPVEESEAAAAEGETPKPASKKSSKTPGKSTPKSMANAPKGGAKSSGAKGGVKASIPRKAS